MFGCLAVNACVRESCVPRFRQDSGDHGAVCAAASSGLHSDFSERFMEKDGLFAHPVGTVFMPRAKGGKDHGEREGQGQWR